MIVELVAAFLISLVVSFVVGRFLVPALRRIKAEQVIRSDGPIWHSKKQGTPTMGGILFIAGIFVSCFTVGLPELLKGDFTHIIILAFALICAGIGFLDDYVKLKKKQNLGLTAKKKFALQILAAIGLIVILKNLGYLSTEFYIPIFEIYFKLPDAAYYIFAVLVVVGIINAVNITDGIDGLVSGVSIPVALFFCVMAMIWSFTAFGVFAAALTGGLAAFLFFNFYPAKVFMGDTGSLFLGGAISAMAFSLDMPLILLPLGIIFILETLSDIIQVTYFKITKGKRVFKMAPLHHHLEMCGWSEYKIFTVFTIISAIFAFVSVLFI